MFCHSNTDESLTDSVTCTKMRQQKLPMFCWFSLVQVADSVKDSSALELGCNSACRTVKPALALCAHVHVPARALVDTGATHCYVSEAFLAKTNVQVREQDTWLSLANGMKAISKGKAVLPLDIQPIKALSSVTSHGWTFVTTLTSPLKLDT